MRALTLTQPWAWLVIHGGKAIENRTWNTSFRGEFLIHASKGMRADDYDSALLTALHFGGMELSNRVPEPKQLERGGIVGIASLVHVVPPFRSGENQARAMKWHFPDQYGFVLQHVRPLPFLPCKGALSFWGNFELHDGRAVQL